MKTRGLKIGKMVPAIMLLFSLTFLAAPKTTNAQMQISFQMFYDQLSPYGQWFQDPQYGYVWTPNVGNDFRPYYTNGHWAMTQYGNMWMSDYAWGWAPFHYGRWTFNPRFGWIWVPGMEWGPAWVTWRHGAGNYGWAPMGPGISVNMSFGNNYYAPYDWWTFIPMNYIYHRNFHRHYAPRNTYNIYNRTNIINNTYIDRSSRTTYVTGPRRNEVERATRSRVEVYNVGTRREAGRPEMSGRNVNVYRPRVNDNGARGNASPRNATRMENSIVTTPTRESNTNRNRNTDTDNRRNNNAVTPNTNNRQLERSNTTTPSRTNTTPNRNTETERNVTPNRNNNQTERNVSPQRNNNVERSTTPRIQSRDDANRQQQQQRATPQQNNRTNTQPRSSNVQQERSYNRTNSSSNVQTNRNSNQVQRSNSTQPSRSSSVSNNDNRNSRSSSVSTNNSSSRSSSDGSNSRSSSSRSQSRGR